MKRNRSTWQRDIEDLLKVQPAAPVGSIIFSENFLKKSDLVSKKIFTSNDDPETMRVLTKALNSDFELTIDPNAPFFPLLDNFINNCLDISNALSAGRWSIPKTNLGLKFLEEYLDDFTIKDGKEYKHFWGLHDELGNPLQEKQTISKQSKFIANEESAFLFLRLAELGVVLKKQFGRIPKGLKDLTVSARSISIPSRKTANPAKFKAIKPEKKTKRSLITK